jgi:short-subunit dehydrogenase
MLARSKAVVEQLAADLPLARAYFADVADASEIEDTFARIAVEQGTVDVLIYNAGKGVWGSAEGLFKNALEIR